MGRNRFSHCQSTRATILSASLHPRVLQCFKSLSIIALHNPCTQFTPERVITIPVTLHSWGVQILTVALNQHGRQSIQSLYIAARHNSFCHFTLLRATMLQVTLQRRATQSLQPIYTRGGHNHPCRFSLAVCPNIYGYFKPAWACSSKIVPTFLHSRGTQNPVTLIPTVPQTFQSLYITVYQTPSCHFKPACDTIDPVSLHRRGQESCLSVYTCGLSKSLQLP